MRASKPSSGGGLSGETRGVGPSEVIERVVRIGGCLGIARAGVAVLVGYQVADRPDLVAAVQDHPLGLIQPNPGPLGARQVDHGVQDPVQRVPAGPLSRWRRLRAALMGVTEAPSCSVMTPVSPHATPLRQPLLVTNAMTP